MNPPVLETIDLRMTYQLSSGMFRQLVGGKGRSVRAVDGVSIAIPEGETLALVGESGSGKTTTGRLITLQERPTGGAIRFEGADGQPRAAGAQGLSTIGPDDLSEPLRSARSALHHRRCRRRAACAPRDRHAQGAARQGGCRPRCGRIAAGGCLRTALPRRPLGRPTTARGDRARAGSRTAADRRRRAGQHARRVGALRHHERDARAAGASGVAYLYITHDLAVARYMASRVAVMYLGAIVEEGPTEELLVPAGHPYTRLLVAAVPEHRAKSRRARVRVKGDAASETGVAAGCRFSPRCPMAQEVCRQVEPPKVQLGRNRWAACHFAAEVASGSR